VCGGFLAFFWRSFGVFGVSLFFGVLLRIFSLVVCSSFGRFLFFLAVFK